LLGSGCRDEKDAAIDLHPALENDDSIELALWHRDIRLGTIALFYLFPSRAAWVGSTWRALAAPGK